MRPAAIVLSELKVEEMRASLEGDIAAEPRPSPALATLTVLWVAYSIVTAFTLYQAMSPLKRDLLLILGVMGAILVIGTSALLRRGRSPSSPTENGRS